MSGRRLVCLCEDVTQKDIDAAVGAGHTDMESVKRYTGLGTGICQGRSCINTLARLLKEHGVDPAALQPTTARAPLWPTPLGTLAALGELPPMYPGPERPGAAASVPPLPTTPTAQAPLPKAAEVVIIGGGIMGLATAYHIAANGLTDVVVLERSYLNAGASGRNGGGVREQWSTEQNVLLMQESLERCKRFSKDFGVNVWLRQGGYLFLATRPEQLPAMEANVALQNGLGVPTQMLSPAQARQIVPELDIEGVLAASYNPEDGVIFPWPFVWGYAEAARRLGVHLATFTPATAIDVQAGVVTGVVTPRGRISCNLVVNAAAAWAPQVAELLGVRLPNQPERHEIMVTESLKPFLEPLVSELGTGLYFSQSMRGELVGGMSDTVEPEGLEMRSSLRFLLRMARALVTRMPALAQVKVVRQWAGCYDRTPDNNPIIGEVPEVRGFFQLHGFVGHGFMMAPAVSRIVGEHIARGTPHPLIDENSVHRFAEGKGQAAETLIIG